MNSYEDTSHSSSEKGGDVFTLSSCSGNHQQQHNSDFLQGGMYEIYHCSLFVCLRKEPRHVADPYRHGNKPSISGKGLVITILSTCLLSRQIQYFKQTGNGITIN